MKNVHLFLLLVTILLQNACKEKQANNSDASAIVPAAEAKGIKFITDATMAKISWEGSSKPLSTHYGTVSISEGSLYVNDGRITAGNFVINMNSIIVADLEGEEKVGLEGHLKGTQGEGEDDFFNVNKFPTAKFEIVELMGASDQPNSNATITGNLTLKGVTKLISFPALISMNSNNISVNTNPFTINRTDFGITYNSKNFFKNLGDKMIDDDITIVINLSAVAESAL